MKQTKDLAYHVLVCLVHTMCLDWIEDVNMKQVITSLESAFEITLFQPRLGDELAFVHLYLYGMSD